MSDDMTTQVFKEEAYELLGELETSLLELEDVPDDMDLINRIFRALHTIKGSGSMFGFEAIAEFTHEVETVFDMVRNGDLAICKELLTLSLSSRDHIYAMLESPDGASDPATGEAILKGLKAIAAGGSLEEPAVQEDAESGILPELPADEPADEPAVAPAKATVSKLPAKLYQIAITPDTGSEVGGEALTPLMQELDRIGIVRSEVFHTGGDAGKGGQWWDVIFESEVDSLSIEEIFFFTDVPITVKVREVAQEDLNEIFDAGLADETGEDLPAAPTKKLGEILVERGDVEPEDVKEVLADQKPLGELLAEKGVVSREQVDSALAEQSAAKEFRTSRKRVEVASSIRVSAEKLDYLVDLVGELVIVQAQISQVVGEKGDPALTVLSEELERLSDELRDSTLGIRMLPIGTTFSKFRRLVRDLSEDLGKEIALQTNGAETELDKTVIERLSDPLIHLLRNSIDHGIEQPDVRKAKGKPGQGTITLTAEHSGGDVLILINDDGKGMSKELIRAKAIEKGLITADAELTAKELFNLIFEPGFSTAQCVTSVSGRGVGMDVVKRAIDSLRGSIDIDSVEDKGTVITIRLPLTLAIIDGLQVRVEGGYYVIPLSLVEECVELTRKDVEESNGQQFVNLRGEIVPYIRIREWFDIEGESPEIEQIVITGLDGNRVGVVVDTVIGEHQTVIKSLGRVYRDVEGISGATIKGDGTLALILDIPKLFRTVLAEIKAAG
ncbi:chemotaxis protein CheA [Maridesulfovibrio hydrothermalis]|uniref:Chemotaxis protein CheA n=1 Tax=Maridesulfovibrio hydrothermalis AM13 = DSM 14728 TaxID=1121451 RepID=L0RDY9_9BACT|nr:chemotaxis protein CheA [Maridesulfovibrio hydrothermalis]CCO24400.1 CheA signal transduction histidine kinase [Maridesulfovibrio hydrothermalis AM13 = DSM 14728]